MRKICETCKFFEFHKDSEFWGRCYSGGAINLIRAECPECDHEDVPLQPRKDFGCIFHAYRCPKCGTEAM